AIQQSRAIVTATKTAVTTSSRASRTLSGDAGSDRTGHLEGDGRLHLPVGRHVRLVLDQRAEKAPRHAVRKRDATVARVTGADRQTQKYEHLVVGGTVRDEVDLERALARVDESVDELAISTRTLHVGDVDLVDLGARRRDVGHLRHGDECVR